MAGAAGHAWRPGSRAAGDQSASLGGSSRASPSSRSAGDPDDSGGSRRCSPARSGSAHVRPRRPGRRRGGSIGRPRVPRLVWRPGARRVGGRDRPRSQPRQLERPDARPRGLTAREPWRGSAGLLEADARPRRAGCRAGSAAPAPAATSRSAAWAGSRSRSDGAGIRLPPLRPLPRALLLLLLALHHGARRAPRGAHRPPVARDAASRRPRTGCTPRRPACGVASPTRDWETTSCAGTAAPTGWSVDRGRRSTWREFEACLRRRRRGASRRETTAERLAAELKALELYRGRPARRGRARRVGRRRAGAAAGGGRVGGVLRGVG